MQQYAHTFSHQHIAIAGVTETPEVYHAVALGRRASVFRTLPGNEPFLPVFTEHCHGLPAAFFEPVKILNERVDSYMSDAVSAEPWRQRNLFRAAALTSLLLAPMTKISRRINRPLLEQCTAGRFQLEAIFGDLHQGMAYFAGLTEEADEDELRRRSDELFIATISRLGFNGCMPQPTSDWLAA